MAGIDQYSGTEVTQGFWSATVVYTPAQAGGRLANAIVESAGSGTVSLSGNVGNVNDEIVATFSPPGLKTFELTLTAVCDIAGGSVFTDGGAYYLFASGALTIGATYEAVSGFGHFAEALGPPACLTEGTQIETQRGMVPVENLQVGDLVLTSGRRYRPVRWVGRRQVLCSAYAPPDSVWPVCVKANTFGPGRPRADIRLSPDHAIACRGRLVPARLLINDMNIRQLPCNTVTYIHVEFDEHCLMFAQGLAVESYFDTGNRTGFPSPLIPLVERQMPTRQKRCAPLLQGGALLRNLQAHIGKQAGYRRTKDARLQVLAGETPLPAKWDGTVLIARIPDGATELSLLSDVAVPSRQTAVEDHRYLGVAVIQISIADHGIELIDPRLTAGWHPSEQTLRWTRGDAKLRLAPGDAGSVIRVQTAPMLEYWQSALTA